MPTDLLAPLLDAVVRATIVLIAAWALTSVMRRAAAATRHFVWSCAVVAALVVPVATAVIPDWDISAPAALTALQSMATRPSAAPAESARPVFASAQPITAPVAALPGVPAAQGADGKDYAAIGLTLWAAGSAAVLFYLMLGTVAAWWMRRSAPPVTAPWLDDALALAEALEVPGPVTFVESAVIAMPMVSGVWRPLVVVPRSAAQWSADRLRVVVLHELAHVKRRDCLTQAIAQIVCAAYWFNPLVWLAARRLRVERERACDDFVLAAGTKGSEYAGHLLDIARAMQSARFSLTSATTLAMARPSQLEGRLMAILDPRIRRSSALLTRVTAVALLLLVALPVAAVRMSAPPAAATAVQSGADLNSTVEQRGSPISRAMASQPQSPAGGPVDVRRSSRATRDELVRADFPGTLFELARRGDLGGIVEMLDAGADVNSEVRGDGSALIGAARGGHLDAVRLLIDRGADVNLGVRGDGNPLIVAARADHMEIVQLLIDRGADLNRAVLGDGNPLIAAAAAGHGDIVRLLLDRGADIHQIVEGDENALIGASAGGHLDVVKLLVERGADVNVRIPVSVHRSGGFDLTRLFTETVEEWRSALSMARRHNRTAVVQYLLSVGAQD